jgi:very-short-patch-repair endonuclease
MKYKTILAFARKLRKNQTPTEKLFWEKVRNRRMFNKKMNRQFIIEHANIMGNKQFFIVDFYCHEKKLIIELDGKIHDCQVTYDLERESILKQMGFQIIRFKNEEVLRHWNTVEQKLKGILLD